MVVDVTLVSQTGNEEKDLWFNVTPNYSPRLCRGL